MSAVNKSMMAECGECCQPGLAVAETGGEERRVTVTRDSHTLLTLTRLSAGAEETEK